MMVSAICLELRLGEKRAKAMCAAMRKTAEVSAMLMVAAKHPSDSRAEEEGDGGERGGESERGEGGAGEVEEVRHRKGVVADGAVGEEGADVGHEGEGAGFP
jgi:hypothetical protein